MTVNVIFEVASLEQLRLEKVITVEDETTTQDKEKKKRNDEYVRSELTRVHKNRTEHVRPHSPC